MIDLEARILRKSPDVFGSASIGLCRAVWPGHSNCRSSWLTLSFSIWSRAVLAVLVQGLSATNGGWILHLQWRQKHHTTVTAQYHICIHYASSYALSIPPPTAVPSQFSRDLSAMIIPMPAMGPMCSSQQHLFLAKVQKLPDLLRGGPPTPYALSRLVLTFSGNLPNF